MKIDKLAELIKKAHDEYYDQYTCKQFMSERAALWIAKAVRAGEKKKKDATGG